MKHLFLLAVAIFSTLTLSAQYRPIVKLIVEGESQKAIEKFEKLDAKDMAKSPSSYALTKALYLDMQGNPKRNTIEAYTTFIEAYVAISASSDTPKLLKGTELTVDGIKLMLENNSVERLFELDEEALYDHYITFAEASAHNQLAEIKLRHELCGYGNAVKANTIVDYDAFLMKYPDTPHRDDIIARRTDLYFARAMASTNEAESEAFIVEYPTYARLDEVKLHLADLRYERVMKSLNYEELEWFTATHPDYSKVNSVWQALADIDFPKLGDDIEAMRRFTVRYPNATQTPDLTKRVWISDIIATADLKGIFEYIEKEGYDRNYYRFAHAISAKHGITILTKDIREVSLVRYIDATLKIGFLDKGGNIAIPASLESSFDSNYDPDNFTSPYMMATEFKKGRDLAAVKSKGKWGVMSLDGSFLTKPTYLLTGFREDGSIVGLKSINEEEGVVEYIVDVYDATGALVQQNYSEWHEYCGDDGDVWYADEWFDEGVTVNISSDYVARIYNGEGKLVARTSTGFYKVTDDYLYYLIDEIYDKVYFINRKGETFSAPISAMAINPIMGNIVSAYSNDMEHCYIIDLDAVKILSSDYRNPEPISDGLICASTNDYKFGYLNDKLEVAIAFNFKYASSFLNGVAMVGDDTGYYLIDTQGNKVSRTYERLSSIFDMPGLFIATEGGLCGIIDLNGEVVVDVENHAIQPEYLNHADIHNGIATWANGVKTRLYEK